MIYGPLLIDYADKRLLLLTYDELRILWDALWRHRLAIDVGDADHDDMVRTLDRVGALLADTHDRLER